MWKKLYQRQRGGKAFNDIQKELADARAEMMRKFAVLGDGFLGSTFKRRSNTINKFDVIGRKDLNIGEYHDHWDICELLEDRGYDGVINCIGISDTRFCEDPNNWEKVLFTNGTIPHMISHVCHTLDIPFIHISTGCVYDQKDGVVTEESPVASHCRYVVSKLCGEYGCDPERDLIIRPRLLFDKTAFDISQTRNNLLSKMKTFDVFLNEFNSVTSVDTIVTAVCELTYKGCTGVYNVAETGTYTIAQMAKHLGLDVKGTIQDYELCASQNLTLVNNVMSVDKLIRDSGWTPPDALDQMKKCFKLMEG